jgi:hypothetical protein
MTKTCSFKSLITISVMDYWCLFGVCLPAGRQGIWGLEFNSIPRFEWHRERFW